MQFTYQIKIYIEGEIETDWQIAYSVRSSFLHNVREDDDRDIRAFLSEARDIWKVDDLIIYTEDGTGLTTDGEHVANDVASSTMYNAERLGEYVSIVQSTIVYTLPMTTDLCMNGSKIVAISIERDLKAFLDSMDFSSFGGSANVYLTQSGGRIISRLTTEGTEQVFNVASLFEDGEMLRLNDTTHTDEEQLTAGRSLTYRFTKAENVEYVVVTPIQTAHQEMLLFYLVPDKIVNETLNDFSRNLTALSLFLIVILAIVVVVIFFGIYRARKRQFDMALHSCERTFDLLVENTKTAFALLSARNGDPVYISKNAADIIGAPFVSLRRTRTGYALGDGNASDALRQINAMLAEWDGKSVFNSGYIRKSGPQGESFYEVQLHPVTGNEDEYVAIIQDVTQQYQREEAVKNALVMAQRSNAAKSMFLSNMSHDIRTPMNAIVNMTRFARESKDQPLHLDEYLQTISESADHLLSLINDVLDMSRIESGQAIIESEPFNVVMELNRLTDIAKPLYLMKRQTLKTDFGGVRAHSVLGDRVKVSQVMMNLLSNANKFTPEGGTVRFTAEQIPSLREGICAMRFTVEDNGIGIPEDKLASIFEAFVRVDDRRVSRIEGTGLGLSICQSYVNAMGGTIICKSVVGKGSAFTVELFFEETEVEPTDNNQAVSIEEKAFAGKRCLLCEDNSVNQIIAKKILEKIGFQVDMASDGREGLKDFRVSAPGTYDVIYMDIQMPVMDGYEAAAAIRECEHPQAKTIPIIAMTANVFAEDVEKARIAGMNGHLGKPINVGELIAETDKILKKNNGGESIR